MRIGQALLGSLIIAGLCAGIAPIAQARDFYIDPASGSMSGDGSSASPWRTLQEVVEADPATGWCATTSSQR